MLWWWIDEWFTRGKRRETLDTKVIPPKHDQEDNDNEGPRQDLIFRNPRDEIMALDAKAIAKRKTKKKDKGKPDRKSALCRSCSGISSAEIQTELGYLLHMNPRSLISSSHYCRLCRLIRRQLGGAMTRGDLDRGSSVKLKAHKTPGKIWVHAYGLHLGELQWFADTSKLMWPYQTSVRAEDFRRSC
jgi:hypothetical protein